MLFALIFFLIALKKGCGLISSHPINLNLKSANGLAYFESRLYTF
jgi:hypothetical protein